MTKARAALAVRIRSELTFADRALGRAEGAWRRLLSSDDDYYLDAVALNLHGFYGGLERIFELTATLVDRDMPTGENWHKSLLGQMAQTIPGVRPAVISSDVREQLDDYRGFRHVVRNVYTYQFDRSKVEHLVTSARPLLVQLRAQASAFADFLDSPHP